MAGDRGPGGAQPELGFDEMVQQVLERVWKPRRRHEPRLAPALAALDKVMVPTAHGAVACWRSGAGPAALLVHGWEDDSTLWKPLMTALVEQSQPFVAFDLPAHGFSEGDRCMIFEVADAVEAVVDTLGPVHTVVAHSFASTAATLAVAEGVPARRLALIAPPLWPKGAGRFHRVARQFDFPDAVAEQARTIYLASSTPSRATFDVRTQLTLLEVELLVVSSLDDERMAVEDARALVPKLRRGELFEVRGPNHRDTARDPQVTSRLVAFIAGGTGD